MRLHPAIDLLGGRAVRLRRGRFDDVTVYSDRPWELAAEWVRAGATALHVVDLDAARGTGPGNAGVVARVREAASASLQVGGGLRSPEAVERILATGVDRAVVGTLAIRRPDQVESLCRDHPGRVVVAVDARGGLVAVSGWTEGTPERPLDLARRAAGWGAAAVLYTDIDRDGLRTGPDVEGTEALAMDAGLPVLASGGIASLSDLERLAAIRPRLEGAVVGRALLEGVFTVEAAIAACLG